MVILAKRQTSNGSSSTVEQFKRKISLPSWVKPEKMKKIRRDGTMTVSFPRERDETRPGCRDRDRDRESRYSLVHMN